MPILQIFKLSHYRFSKYICHLLLLLSLYVSAHQSHERRSIKWKRASTHFVRLWHSGFLANFADSSILIFHVHRNFVENRKPTLASFDCTNTTSSSSKHSHPLHWYCSLAKTNQTCVFFQVSTVGSDFTQLSLKTTWRFTWILRFASHGR